MKKTFYAYFRKSDKELSELWENAFFAVDANVLLNLYRYSDETRKALLDALSNKGKNLFLPHQVGLEFVKNRFKIIDDQARKYDSTISNVKKLEETLKAKREHPFISQNKLGKFLKASTELIHNLEESKNNLPKIEQGGTLLDEVSQLFEGKTGEPLTEEWEAFEKDAKSRYEREIPPGYKDATKGGTHQYGDLIIWKQLIAFAKEKKRAVIFITDDRKEDWWIIHSGKTICTRPELLEEFKKETQQDFLMYTVERFLEFGAKLRQEEIDPTVIAEVKDTRIPFEQPTLDSFIEETQKRQVLRMVSQNVFKEIKRVEKKHFQLADFFHKQARLSDYLDEHDILFLADKLYQVLNLVKKLPESRDKEMFYDRLLHFCTRIKKMTINQASEQLFMFKMEVRNRLDTI